MNARPHNSSPGPGTGQRRSPRWLSAVIALMALTGLNHGCARDQAQPQPQPIIIDAANSGVVRPYVLVNGIATIDLRPDVADVTITLSVERPRPNAALSELQTQREGLVASLAELGVSGVNLRSSHTGVSTVYEPRGDREIRGYQASQTFVASLTDFDGVGDVLERAAAFELGSMHTRYRSTRMPEKKRELREMALRAAELKAQQSAKVLDVTLGPVLSIEETGRNVGGWGSNANIVENDFATEGTTGAPIEPGAVPMTLTVEVRYALAENVGVHDPEDRS